jgi:hypothetical protein
MNNKAMIRYHHTKAQVIEDAAESSADEKWEFAEKSTTNNLAIL